MSHRKISRGATCRLSLQQLLQDVLVYSSVRDEIVVIVGIGIAVLAAAVASYICEIDCDSSL